MVAGSILSRGKVCLFGIFSFPIIFGGQCGVETVGAKQVGLSLESARRVLDTGAVTYQDHYLALDSFLCNKF